MSGLSYGEGVFLDFFEAVAACEPPEETQLDEVLRQFQQTFTTLKLKERDAPRDTPVVTVTNPPGQEGAAYRLTLPGGESRVIGDGSANYWKLAEVIDAVFPIKEVGMPAIIWSGENGAADRWLEDLDRLTVNEGYSVQVTLIPGRGGEVILGNLVRVDRSDPPEGWPRITVRLPNGRPRVLLSDEIASIFIY